MNQKLSLGQRLLADTPAFFKVTHFIGLAVVILSVVFAKYVPGDIGIVLKSVGSAIAVLSPFAVNDVAALQAAPNLLDGLANLLPDLVTQLAQVKDAFNSPVVTSIPEAVINVRDAITGQDPAAAAPESSPAAAAPALSVVTD